jgi:hypothetical protein
MSEHQEQQFAGTPDGEGMTNHPEGQHQAGVVPVPTSETSPLGETAEAALPLPEQNGVASHSRHVEAGRKGALRVHELIQRGRLYEREHGLKRGRQRLRQLIEEGKRYEAEHGLSPQRRRARGLRMSPNQRLRRLFDALLPLVKPAYRSRLAQLVQALEAEGK